VLVNLVGNAVKFSSGREQAGRVSVRVVTTGRSPEQVEIDIHVIDNGIGMDAATQARVFDAFTQADASTTRRFGGTGLGLVISRHLVELMGGDLMLQSTPGRGSRFTVSLQFALAEGESDAVKLTSEVAGLCCLAVGGPDELTENIAAYLSHGGARVERAVDLAEARTLTLGWPAGRWTWIIDAATVLSINELRAFAQSQPEQQIRFVAIRRGARREQHVVSGDLLSVDGNALTRRRLFRAVAVAAGRAFEEESLPLSGGNGAAFEPPARDEALRCGRLVLIAEDNETNQKVVLRQLALLGVAADVADNGRLALELWQSGNYALLLSDIHMPVMDGYELTAAIRAQEKGRARVPIVALTANALKGEADHCRAAGMDDYLSKPFQLTALKGVLDRWLPAAAPVARAESEAVETPPAQAVDVSVLEKLVGDDPEVIRDFLGDFQLSATKIARALTAAYVHGRPAQASEQAHKLKSSARSMGALALGELCAEIECAGNSNGGSETLTLLMPMFEQELHAVNAFLDSLKVQPAGHRQNK
jgi:two-component system sensor histidine kinase/response regulator